MSVCVYVCVFVCVCVRAYVCALFLHKILATFSQRWLNRFEKIWARLKALVVPSIKFKRIMAETSGSGDITEKVT